MRKIRFGAWINEEYSALVSNMYQEQAARCIQRYYRSYLARNGKTVSLAKSNETLIGRFRLAVFQEPTDKKYLEHNQKINEWRYLDLDFKDPEFTRNVFKALRLNKINLNQMLMAKQLYDAIQMLHTYDGSSSQLKHYAFSDPHAPFQASMVSYATAEQIARFYRSLKPEDSNYITINFPKWAEKIFFEIGIEKALFSKTSFFDMANKKYNAHAQLVADSDLSTPAVFDQQSICSIEFLLSLLNLDEQHPTLALSPDYRQEDAKSPVLCFVLLTFEAEKQLQLAVHGCETMHPYSTAGKVTTRMIRVLDEQKQSRPIEITHPDIKQCDRPHNYDCHDFMLTWHDRFHCWRAGANFKPLIRYLRKLISKKGVCQKKSSSMSVGIWALSDMDFNLGSSLRKNLNIANRYDSFEVFNKAYINYARHQFISDLLELLSRSLDIQDQYSDLFAYFVIDLIRNETVWNEFIKILPGCDSFLELLSTEDPDLQSFLSEKTFELKNELELFLANQSLLTIIKENSHLPSESIILRCKLHLLPNAEALCKTIDELGIQQFFYWGINSGLHIHRQFRDHLMEHCSIHQFSLSKLDPTELSQALGNCVEQLYCARVAQYS